MRGPGGLAEGPPLRARHPIIVARDRGHDDISGSGPSPGKTGKIASLPDIHPGFRLLASDSCLRGCEKKTREPLRSFFFPRGTLLPRKSPSPPLALPSCRQRTRHDKRHLDAGTAGNGRNVAFPPPGRQPAPGARMRACEPLAKPPAEKRSRKPGVGTGVPGRESGTPLFPSPPRSPRLCGESSRLAPSVFPSSAGACPRAVPDCLAPGRQADVFGAVFRCLGRSRRSVPRLLRRNSGGKSRPQGLPCSPPGSSRGPGLSRSLAAPPRLCYHAASREARGPVSAQRARRRAAGASVLM
jgi:hypothetical protein